MANWDTDMTTPTLLGTAWWATRLLGVCSATWMVAGLTAVSAAFFLGVLGLAAGARRRPVITGSEEMIGSTGKVVDWAGGTGRVHVHGEIWAAESGAMLAKGQKVRVVGRTGLTLAVEPKT